MADQNEQQKKWANILEKAWDDEDYKQRLLKDTASVIKEEGIDLPEGIEFKCVENTPERVWLVLPPKPDGKNLLGSDALDDVSGGTPRYTMPPGYRHGWPC